MGSESASSPTVRPPDPSSSTMARRFESPSASKGSPVKAVGIERERNKNATVSAAEHEGGSQVKAFEASSTIAAKPEAIWAILTDGATKSLRARSEEHTSELQSQSNLVCRLLLEKKKNIPPPPPYS